MTVSQRQGPGWFTFATGVVYGLQPDALFVIVPALALPTKAAAAAYILMFVIGTVTAMGGYTAVIGAPSLHLCCLWRTPCTNFFGQGSHRRWDVTHLPACSISHG